MAKFDLKIVNGRLATTTGVFPVDIGVKEGRIVAIGKQGNIWEVAAGNPGIQTMLPLLITEGVKKGRITLPQLVRVISEGPARICGLYPKKGSAMIGADADFAIFDLKKEREVKVEEQIQLEYSLYEGLEAAYPDMVLVRGKAVVDDGQIVGKAGYGEYCTPQKAAKQ